MTEIRTTIAGSDISVRVDRTAPLGWRFWTLAGFPKDPTEPSPYGGSRYLPLATISSPVPIRTGGKEFAREILASHAQQPKLL